MFGKEIEPNKANIVSENCLLVTKMRRKRSLPNERGLEETEKEGKWKNPGGEGTERRQRGEEGTPSEIGERCPCPTVGLGSTWVAPQEGRGGEGKGPHEGKGGEGRAHMRVKEGHPGRSAWSLQRSTALGLDTGGSSRDTREAGQI